ncbi:MAG: HAD family hydrolase [Bacteroidota bacterium]
MQAEALILDLGGVLIDIDYGKTAEALSRVGGVDFHPLFSQAEQIDLFSDYECGRIQTEEFRDGLRSYMRLSPSDDELDAAWNAMVGQFSAGRLDLVRKMAEQIPVFLLSNINALHEQAIQDRHVGRPDEQDFECMFNGVYFSHRIGLRKPDPAVFRRILDEQDLLASSTVFIDDSIQHVIAAKSLGINALWLNLNAGISLEDLLF